MNSDLIRNFCIIAHVDHGKSTLADRLLEATGSISLREKKDQFLDNMELERERGITIKAQTVRLNYKAKDGKTYELNLIDTPGHVDFRYEVSRSLAACEGALLVVDATQGIQAQTVANAFEALDHKLELVPVINKIDLPGADIDSAVRQIEDVFGIDASHSVPASAKTGEGVAEILERIVQFLPPPRGRNEAPLRALLIDSWFDSYQGVVCLMRVVDGKIKKGDQILMMNADKTYEVLKLGIFAPRSVEVDILEAGDVGYLVAGIREVRDTKIGDTITLKDAPASHALPGFKEIKPIVFAGIYPTDSGQYDELRDALLKLKLNDSSFTYEPETSMALGFGFRCGFLGSLHLEVIMERLEREYNLELICTAPTVGYQVMTTDGAIKTVSNPADFPETQLIEVIEEPYAMVNLIAPSEYLGAIIQLCQEKRGEQQNMEYLTKERVRVQYLLPFQELISDFHDRLKACSKGFASLDYKLHGYREGKLVKLNILINGDHVDALSVIVHRDQAYARGRDIAGKLRRVIPRQQYEVAIQAAVGNKPIARETVKPLRKNVTAKCYGGDVTRKRKLLEKQKEGKKRMKMVGVVEIPQEAFLTVLKAK
ncbi:MAG: elongation factor 4 [Deltaproteobacteria bacterium CG11_big_fil_rev_8_21_14_0_20_49_13]|nr:MAG: elongation factor 4 [Deltaproteobacteria bacterium CG11_big_fil_rev_8_21_14_0_20_49_13]